MTNLFSVSIPAIALMGCVAGETINGRPVGPQDRDLLHAMFPVYSYLTDMPTALSRSRAVANPVCKGLHGILGDVYTNAWANVKGVQTPVPIEFSNAEVYECRQGSRTVFIIVSQYHAAMFGTQWSLEPKVRLEEKGSNGKYLPVRDWWLRSEFKRPLVKVPT